MVFFLVFLGKPKRRFFGNRADRSGAEYAFLPEHLLCEVVSMRLILSGEVQIDIGYLVTLKPEKSLEGNVLSFPLKLLSTLWAGLVRKVESAWHAAVEKPLAMLAFRINANIMRRQRVNLRYPEKCRDDRRAH
ncbi:hypothetical protein D3C77_568450 [compost metagenome]